MEKTKEQKPTITISTEPAVIALNALEYGHINFTDTDSI